METSVSRRNYRIRLLCILLLAALCGTAVGCAKEPAADACGAFLAYLNAGDFSNAYDMLTAGVRYDENRAANDLAKGNTQPEKRISKEQFVERHTAIFEELGVSGLDYAISAAVEGEIICVYDYALTYRSEKIGDQKWEFRMSVLRQEGEWKIDWSPALIFPSMDWGDTIRVGSTKAARGEILADGEVYAATVKAVSVTFVPSKIQDRDQFIRQTCTLLDMTTKEVEKELGRSYVIDNDFGVLKQFRPEEMTETLKAELLLIPGVGIDVGNFGVLRDYPNKSSLAHILGYVRQADEDDLTRLTGGVLDAEGRLVDKETGEPLNNALYNADSVVGKLGLERQYETELRGEDGSYTYICAKDGTNKGVLYEIPVQNGLDVQLTVNPDLQERTEALLTYSLFGDSTAGAVVVMNPHTGAIEAMSSYPSYDLNQFTRRISEADYSLLSEAPNKPLYNRLTQGTYPPGSTLKPFTAAAALESGAMSPNDAFPEGRGEEITLDAKGDQRMWRPSDDGEFGPWGGGVFTRVKIDHRHTPLNMYAGIVDSDNVYFAYAALKTGFEPFMDYMKNLGLEEAIPFDLSVSKAKLLNEETKETIESGTLDATHTRLQILGVSAFGQGEMLVTPLQVASMFCAFSNGGDILEPYIVKGLYRTEGTDYAAVSEREPTVWKKGVIAPSSIRTIEPMLVDVVNDGTGWALNYTNINSSERIRRNPRLTNIAAKTGTAQVGEDKSREINWFVGYRTEVPEEEARLVLVMLEVPANDQRYSSLKYDIAYDLLKPDEVKENS